MNFLEDKKKQLGEELGPVIKSIKLNLSLQWMYTGCWPNPVF
jgi:hypothetical protein